MSDNTTINNRQFQKVEKIAFSLPPMGIFNARLASLAFIGTYTKTFKNNDGVEESKELEMVGLNYQFTDLNTGELSEALTECVLSYHPDSRLYASILGLNNGEPLKENTDLSSLLGNAVRIEIIHQSGKDKQGNAKQYASIKSVSPLDANMTQPPQVESTVYYDIQAHDEKIYETLNRKHTWLIENKSHEKGKKLTQKTVEKKIKEVV